MSIVQRHIGPSHMSILCDERNGSSQRHNASGDAFLPPHQHFKGNFPWKLSGKFPERKITNLSKIFSIVSDGFSFFSYYVQKKPPSKIWDHFVGDDDAGNILLQSQKPSSARVMCIRCGQKRLTNATRMAELYLKCSARVRDDAFVWLCSFPLQVNPPVQVDFAADFIFSQRKAWDPKQHGLVLSDSIWNYFFVDGLIIFA